MTTIQIKGTPHSVKSGLYVGGEWLEGKLHHYLPRWLFWLSRLAIGHGDKLESINPATEERIATVQTASAEDIDKAVSIAREAFENTVSCLQMHKVISELIIHQWGTNTSGTERGRLLSAFADVSPKYSLCLICPLIGRDQAIEKHTDELGLIESVDTGKPLSWCKADVGDAVTCLRYFA